MDYHVGELAIFSKILNEDLKINKNKIFFTDWKKIWNDIGLLEIEKWRIDYGLTHLLTESDKIYDYKILFRNDLYTIYDLTNKGD